MNKHIIKMFVMLFLLSLQTTIYCQAIQHRNFISTLARVGLNPLFLSLEELNIGENNSYDVSLFYSNNSDKKKSFSYSIVAQLYSTNGNLFYVLLNSTSLNAQNKYDTSDNIANTILEKFSIDKIVLHDIEYMIHHVKTADNLTASHLRAALQQFKKQIIVLKESLFVKSTKHRLRPLIDTPIRDTFGDEDYSEYE